MSVSQSDTKDGIIRDELLLTMGRDILASRLSFFEFDTFASLIISNFDGYCAYMERFDNPERVSDLSNP